MHSFDIKVSIFLFSKSLFFEDDILTVWRHRSGDGLACEISPLMKGGVEGATLLPLLTHYKSTLSCGLISTRQRADRFQQTVRTDTATVATPLPLCTQRNVDNRKWLGEPESTHNDALETTTNTRGLRSTGEEPPGQTTRRR